MIDLDPILLWPLALVFILMAAPVVSRKIWGPVDYMLPHDVLRRIQNDDPILILDIRNSRTFGEYAIPGAINLSIDELENYVSRKASAEIPVVLVCQSDLSATRHAARLSKKGYANVAALKGGMLAWKKAKYPMK